jgi:UDP-N-acetylmuramate dehydrogenase
MINALPIQKNVSLKPWNTFGIEAVASTYLSIDNIIQLQSLVADAELKQCRPFILGGGSNIILPDQVDALVLHIALQGKNLLREDEDYIYVRAAAGENWHQFVQWTLAQGWGGLENLSLIPGTVGAAPIQNIGAYGVEIKDHFFQLTAFDLSNGDIRILDRDACQFAYRDSVFKHAYKNNWLILDVTFALPKRWQANLRYADLAQRCAAQGLTEPTPADISALVIALRQSKLPDPAVLGNAGSFFKNPLVEAAQRDGLLAQFPDLVSYPQEDGRYKLAAGWLIERSGWKGKRDGAVGVYEQQALVLVNHGGASGTEVRAFAKQVQVAVWQQFAVELEIEPIFVTE